MLGEEEEEVVVHEGKEGERIEQSNGKLQGKRIDVIVGVVDGDGVDAEQTRG